MNNCFKATIHTFKLGNEMRTVVDPRTIPSNIRDILCLQGNYSLPSVIGPNHHVAHYDLARQGWRDMRNAIKVQTLNEQDITFNGSTLTR